MRFVWQSAGYVLHKRLFGCGRAIVMQEAIGSYERCLELAPQSRNAGQNRLLALNYIVPGEDAAVCTAHIEWCVSRIC